MSNLIFFYDGGGKWAAQFAIVLILCVLALVVVYDERCHFWKDGEGDDE